jgi:hypothetical protein
MKMEHYIGQLLYRYQCVTVPGFGAFLTEIIPAQINQEANGFYPPKKLVSFNSYLKNNDGLLASHISQQESISYENAVQNIQKEVSLWKNALENSQSLLLNNIGMISLNSEGSLVFENTGNVNYHTASFGLSSLISPIIKRETITLVIEKQEEKEVTSLVPRANWRFNHAKYAAVLVTVLGTAGFFGNSYYQNQIVSETQLVQSEVQKAVQQKIQEATFFIQNPLPDVILTVKEQKLPYHIVAGAFREEKNAQRIFERLSNSGFKARRLEKNKFGLFPVLYGSYSTYTEAQNALSEIHKSQSPDAWLMIDKK